MIELYFEREPGLKADDLKKALVELKEKNGRGDMGQITHVQTNKPEKQRTVECHQRRYPATQQ
jgi:hypothetical protein